MQRFVLIRRLTSFLGIFGALKGSLSFKLCFHDSACNAYDGFTVSRSPDFAIDSKKRRYDFLPKKIPASRHETNPGCLAVVGGELASWHHAPKTTIRIRQKMSVKVNM